MSKWEFILQLLREGREWLMVLVPFLVGLHVKQPKYMQRKPKAEEPHDGTGTPKPE